MIHFFHPRYWLVWFFYTLTRATSFLSFPAQIYLGRKLGFLLYHLSSKRRRIAEINLKLCFPDSSEEERKTLLKNNFETMGICFFEIGMFMWWPDYKFRSIGQVDGLDNLINALKRGKGVLLLAGHFTTMIIMGRILRLHVNFNATYRKMNNELMDYIVTSKAEFHKLKLVPHDALRTIIQYLRDNIAMIYVPDQNFGRSKSIFVPFFGIQTATVTATSRLAEINDSPVIPIINLRRPDDSGYQIVIGNELENFPSDDIEQDTIRVNQLLEKQIRKSPDGYLWIHRRFKTRPEGEEPFYN